MSGLYLTVGAVAVALVVYLVMAMLKPELFP